MHPTDNSWWQLQVRIPWSQLTSQFAHIFEDTQGHEVPDTYWEAQSQSFCLIRWASRHYCTGKMLLHCDTEGSRDLGCGDSPSIIVLIIDWQGGKISDDPSLVQIALGHKLDLHIKRIALERRLACDEMHTGILLGSDKLRDSSKWSKCLVVEAELRTIKSEGWLVLELGTPWGAARIQKWASLMRWVHDIWT